MPVTRSAVETSWLRWYATPASARVSLVCLPPAGGAASFFRTWAPYAGDRAKLAAVQYPGRENRLSEPPLEDLHQLADGAAQAVTALVNRPIVLFGHSLGAAVAYEMALRLDPAALIVSGCAPPAVHEARAKRVWTDAAILDDLRRLGGPNQLVLQHDALRALVMPALRADYNLTERYVPSRSTLRCPVVAFRGTRDDEVTGEEMAGWRAVTDGPFELEAFAGGHFFPLERKEEVVARIVGRLQGDWGR